MGKKAGFGGILAVRTGLLLASLTGIEPILTTGAEDQNGPAIGGAMYGSILVAGVGFEPTTFWL